MTWPVADNGCGAQLAERSLTIPVDPGSNPSQLATFTNDSRTRAEVRQGPIVSNQVIYNWLNHHLQVLRRYNM